MNRREALRLGAALVGGAWLGKLLPTAPESTSRVPAADLARMEASANRSRYPRTWPLLSYDGGLQFSTTQVLIYGYGRPVDTQAACARWVEFLDDPALDAGTSDDGRAWAILTAGLFSDGCRREQHKASAERDHGQRVLEIYVRREEHRRRLAR